MPLFLSEQTRGERKSALGERENERWTHATQAARVCVTLICLAHAELYDRTQSRMTAQKTASWPRRPTACYRRKRQAHALLPVRTHQTGVALHERAQVICVRTQLTRTRP